VGKDGRPKYQLLRRVVCAVHGSKGAGHGCLSQTVKRTQLERDRLAREQRTETRRRRAALSEKVAEGVPVGVRAPPPPSPAPGPSLWDQFTGGRRQPSEQALPPLYPGVAGPRRRY
jgi:hypothetical protein